MSLDAQLAAYLTRRWQAPVEIEGLSRIPGGASRETYRFDALVGDTRRPLILRRDPAGSLIDTDRRTEFEAYRTAHGRLPVPEPIALEIDGAELDRPFFLMQRIDGGIVTSPFAAQPFGAHAPAIGIAFFHALGTLAALNPAGTPLGSLLPAPAPDQCWRVALDHWAAAILRDEAHPQPIVRAAIRRLYRHPPPPAQAVRILHGDYRSGNLMHDGAGQILAILDWELAHLGDPLEDLGWAFDPLWNHFDPGTVCGMIPQAQAIALWEAASGLRVDPAALRWWQLFNAVKGQAIWTGAAREYRGQGCIDPILGISAWYTARRHDEILADQLQRFGDAA
ncbi:phosphotransferase family protein [Sphingomonas hylomeconis]|uniref:Phosphotransferase family protein n=1 Tax=Sphingomonas hylomeconis TaxID=1395958 RepID=A0ABV7STB6_9SPHN|nr:phosphotransferase family protein [Sphingomonas hylomeconis]